MFFCLCSVWGLAGVLSLGFLTGGVRRWSVLWGGGGGFLGGCRQPSVLSDCASIFVELTHSF